MTSTTIEIHLGQPGHKYSMEIAFPEFDGWTAVDSAGGMALQYLIGKFGTRVKKNVFETSNPELIEIGKKLHDAKRHEKHNVVFEMAKKISKNEKATTPPNVILDFSRDRASKITVYGDNQNKTGDIVISRCQGMINFFTFLGNASVLHEVTDNEFKLSVSDPEVMTKIATAVKFPLGGLCRAFNPDDPTGYSAAVNSIRNVEARKRAMAAKLRTLISGTQLKKRSPFGDITIEAVKTSSRNKWTFDIDDRVPAHDVYITLQSSLFTVTHVMKALSNSWIVSEILKKPALECMEANYIMKTPTSLVSTASYKNAISWTTVEKAIRENIPIATVLSLEPPEEQY